MGRQRDQVRQRNQGWQDGHGKTDRGTLTEDTESKTIWDFVVVVVVCSFRKLSMKFRVNVGAAFMSRRTLFRNRLLLQEVSLAEQN